MIHELMNFFWLFTVTQVGRRIQNIRLKKVIPSVQKKNYLTLIVYTNLQTGTNIGCFAKMAKSSSKWTERVSLVFVCVWDDHIFVPSLFLDVCTHGGQKWRMIIMMMLEQANIYIINNIFWVDWESKKHTKKRNSWCP